MLVRSEAAAVYKSSRKRILETTNRDPKRSTIFLARSSK